MISVEEFLSQHPVSAQPKTPARRDGGAERDVPVSRRVSEAREDASGKTQQEAAQRLAEAHGKRHASKNSVGSEEKLAPRLFSNAGESNDSPEFREHDSSGSDRDFSMGTGSFGGTTRHSYYKSKGSKRRSRRHAETRNSGSPRTQTGNFAVTQAQDPNDLDACREAALRLLDAAARSSGSLREKLLERGYAPEVVEDVIQRLTRVQLLDDEAYAQSLVRYCAQRMMGYRATVMEMTRKGLERPLAENVARAAGEEGIFEDAAWELGRNVARRTQGLDPEVRKRRFWSAGGRKGHDPGTLKRIAEELF